MPESVDARLERLERQVQDLAQFIIDELVGRDMERVVWDDEQGWLYIAEVRDAC